MGIVGLVVLTTVGTSQIATGITLPEVIDFLETSSAIGIKLPPECANFIFFHFAHRFCGDNGKKSFCSFFISLCVSCGVFTLRYYAFGWWVGTFWLGYFSGHVRLGKSDGMSL